MSYDRKRARGGQPCPACDRTDRRCAWYPAKRPPEDPESSAGPCTYVLCRGEPIVLDTWVEMPEPSGAPAGSRAFILPDGSSASDSTHRPRKRRTWPPLELHRVLQRVLDVAARHTNQAHANRAAAFYRERGVPADPDLYRVAPSWRGAGAIVREALQPEGAYHADFPGVYDDDGRPRFLAHGSGDASSGAVWELCRDPAGRLVGYSVRRLDPNADPKVLTPMSPRPGWVLGWPERVRESGALLLTEGFRNANEAQRLLGVGAVGFVSVTPADPYEEVRRVLRSGDVLHELWLAPDFADLANGKRGDEVREAVERGWLPIAREAEALGITVRGLAWDSTAAKGVDDALAAGLEIERLELDDWLGRWNWKAPRKPAGPRVPFEDAEPKLRALISEARTWARDSRGIAVVEGPPGVGKTTAVLEEARTDPALAFFGPNFHELHDKARDLGRPVHTRQGIARACKKPGARVAADGGMLEGWRHRACEGCDRKAACPVWEEPPADLPLFAPHHAAPHLTDEDLTGRTVIYDEAPPVLDVHTIDTTSLAAARGARMRVPGEGAEG